MGRWMSMVVAIACACGAGKEPASERSVVTAVAEPSKLPADIKKLLVLPTTDSEVSRVAAEATKLLAEPHTTDKSELPRFEKMKSDVMSLSAPLLIRKIELDQVVERHPADKATVADRQVLTDVVSARTQIEQWLKTLDPLEREIDAKIAALTPAPTQDELQRAEANRKLDQLKREHDELKAKQAK